MKFSTRKWVKSMTEANNKERAKSRIDYFKDDLKRDQGDLWQFDIEGSEDYGIYAVIPEWLATDEEYVPITVEEFKKELRKGLKELRKIA